MQAKIYSCPVLFFLVFSLFCLRSEAPAAWEAGAKMEFDSNIDRSIENATKDVSLSAYLSYSREPDNMSRLDWFFLSTISGTVYQKTSDLSYGEIAVTPGISYCPYRSWNIMAGPFFSAKGSNDSDQSALDFGGKITLRQQPAQNFYTGEYYMYKNSSAEDDIYSYEENVLGVYAGLNWKGSSTIEAGYEYSHGDSFQGVGDTVTEIPESHGQGHRYKFSSAFDTFLIREKVDTHEIRFSIGIDWTSALFSAAGYSFTNMEGDAGSSTIHAGYISMGYKF